MAVVGSLIVLLGTNNTALTGGLLKAEGQLKTFGATAGTTGAMAGAALAGVGLVAVAGLGMAVMAAKSFQEQMAKVNTIVHMGEEPLAALGQEVRNLSVATGVGVGDLTSALYDLFSVGVPAGQAMEFLTNATTLSIGGLSTANEAVNAITTAINSWSTATGAAKLTMADSARVVDIFAQAIAAGGMTAADIPGALANVAAQAAMMNMPLEEVAATWAILTVRGLSASEASTSLAATLTALAKAPPGMEKLQKATGKTYLQIAKTQGIHEAVMQVVADAQKFGVVLEDVFGRKEALPFVTFTTGGEGDLLWAQALAGEYNSAGVAAGQMEERMGTLDAKLRIFGTTVNELAIKVGTALLPAATQFVTDLTGAVGTLEDTIQKVVDLYNSLPAFLTDPINIEPVAPNLIAPQAPGLGVKPGLTDVVGQALGIIPQGVFSGQPKPWGTFGTPGFGAGDPGSPFAGPPAYMSPATPGAYGSGLAGMASDRALFRLLGAGGVGTGLGGTHERAPIHLHHTVINQIDGREISRLTETTLYNDASVYSSGFSTDDQNRH